MFVKANKIKSANHSLRSDATYKLHDDQTVHRAHASRIQLQKQNRKMQKMTEIKISMQNDVGNGVNHCGSSKEQFEFDDPTE